MILRRSLVSRGRGGGRVLDIRQILVPKEPQQHRGTPLQPAQRPHHDLLKLIRTGHLGTTHTVAQHDLPHSLVRGQLRRIRRQPVQGETPIGGFHPVAYSDRAVHQVPIHDQHHRTVGVLEQPLSEVDELRCVHGAVDDGEAQLPARGDRRDHDHAEPGPVA